MRKLKFKRFLHQIKILKLKTIETQLTCENRISINKKSCYDKYGFVSNPRLTLQKNLINALRQMPTKIYFNSPQNLAFHNLCTTLHPPSGLGTLLGLGHKFIPQKKTPNLKLHETFEELTRDVRLKYFFAEENLNTNDDDFHPRLYIKSKWNPPRANDDVEDRLENFFQNIKTHKSKYSPTKSSNMSRLQYRALKFLKNNEQFIVAQADKNLGPVLIERENYIKTVFNHHLSDKKTYTIIDLNIFREELTRIKRIVGQLFLSVDTKDSITFSDKTYFKRLFQKEKMRRPMFYILFKIHKQPWSTRPVVSCCGSLLASVST